MKKGNNIFGIILIVIGIAILSPFPKISGYVVGENFEKFVSSIFGVVFVIVGIVLFVVGKEEGELEHSVREAVKLGVPKEDAKRIFNELKEKVESKEWIELGSLTIRAADNKQKYPQGTSLCRYWGSPKYKNLPNHTLKDLYESGKIGKTHEIVTGSDKWEIGGSLFKRTVTIPAKGSQVSHRHWEIEQMYKYRKKNK